ncbi:MAG TPA: glutamate--tRNA ligase [Candidatus Saccharimonadales bacterium]|nr:glutamate--tRNA ligase [Candidatus Saccharimonadales bacterium]
MTEKPKVRVRFAPSPTGYLHIGNLRSALFSYLYARHTQGSFILRIEDTDRARLVEDAVDYVKENLLWLGLNWDEGIEKGGEHGPYVQSERLNLYAEHAEALVEQGKAYRDYTSSQRLEGLRQHAQKAKQPFKFTKDMAQLEPDHKDDPFVIRFEIKPGPNVIWNDAVWGEQTWKRKVLDDFVALKSDGFPTYNFAVVVDDHLMEISHVLRGQEFLSTTPKNILVYEAFDWQIPQFVHLPPVLGPDKSKLSKRHGAKSALEYRDAGYLSEAVFNYLASLGFNDGTTQEIYTPAELAKVFNLGRIQASPAIFDPDRLDWMNGVHIRQMTTKQLLVRSAEFWPPEAKKFDEAYRLKVLELIKERLKYFAEIPELTSFFFTDPKLNIKPDSQPMLLKVVNKLEDSDFSEKDLENRLRALVAAEDLKTGQVFGIIRLAVTGKTAAPGLFETLHVLGKETSLRRLRHAAGA